MVSLEQLRLIHEMREQGVEWQVINDTIPEFTDNDRKVYSGWLMSQQEKSDGELVKHAKTLQKIRQTRKELGIERSINNEQIRDISLHKTFTNQVLDAINDKYIDYSIDKIPFESNNDRVHIFTLADLHWNGDDIGELFYKMDNVYSKIKDVIDKKELDHIYLFELGDVIEGASLRNSQLMAVKSGMVNQIIQVADAYIKLISKLSKDVSVTFVSVDSSNHTQLRQLGTKQNQLIEEDLMLVFNKIIEKALPELDFIHGEDVIMHINGFTFFISHGHLVKKKEKYIETLQSNRNVLIDFGFFGHFHHQRSIDLHDAGGYDRRVFYVPTMSGDVTDYEKSKNLSSTSGIGYYVFEQFIGHIEERKLKV